MNSIKLKYKSKTDRRMAELTVNVERVVCKNERGLYL